MKTRTMLIRATVSSSRGKDLTSALFTEAAKPVLLSLEEALARSLKGADGVVSVEIESLSPVTLVAGGAAIAKSGKWRGGK